jgi:hypothetical protein
VEHVVDPESRCLPGGIPREDAGDGGFQFLQVQGTTAFLYQYGTFRLIPTDGRKHTEDPDSTYFGEAIGSWDGDTFVIDSVGFKDANSWADENADPVSDTRHIVERWTRSDLGHLHLELLIEDPKFYKQPIHFQRNWLLAPGRQTREEACTETISTYFPAIWARDRGRSERMERAATTTRLRCRRLPRNPILRGLFCRRALINPIEEGESLWKSDLPQSRPWPDCSPSCRMSTPPFLRGRI